MKHTTGPWKVAETRLNYDTVIRGTKSEPIALVQIAGYSKHEGEANSRLIAAAPELLELCQISLHCLHDSPDLLVLMRKAIAKATGEPA